MLYRLLYNKHQEEVKAHSPETCEDTVSRVMTPRVTLAGTQSTSIQNETQEMATMRMEGR